MGGVLIEQYISQLDPQQRKNVLGVIEFGTPHSAVNVLDQTLEGIKWQFYAGNLFQPFGMYGYGIEEYAKLWMRCIPMSQISFYLSNDFKESKEAYEYKVMQLAEGKQTYFTQTGMTYFLVPPDKAFSKNAKKIFAEHNNHRELATMEGPNDTKYKQIIGFIAECLDGK